MKLNSMVQSVGQLDFVPPVQSPEDIQRNLLEGLGVSFSGTYPPW